MTFLPGIIWFLLKSIHHRFNIQSLFSFQFHLKNSIKYCVKIFVEDVPNYYIFAMNTEKENKVLNVVRYHPRLFTTVTGGLLSQSNT